MYTLFKVQKLSMDESVELVSNGIKQLRNSESSPYDASQHNYYLTLFQAVAHFERVTLELQRCKKENIELKDEDFYTPDWRSTVNEYTNEYRIALEVCGPIYLNSITHSMLSAQSACACTLLNELIHVQAPYPAPHTLRHKQADHILTMPLTYSDFKLNTQQTQILLKWYPPSILLCPDIPDGLLQQPEVYLTFEWIWNKDNHPPTRFKTYAEHVLTSLNTAPLNIPFKANDDVFSLI